MQSPIPDPRSLLLFFLLALLAPVAPSHAQVPLQPCTVTGVMRESQCGQINVPEDRANPAGRQVALNVMVIKGATPRDADPVLFFAGGPGQGGATLAQQVAPELVAAAPARDIVLIDQRGTGRSRPLTCDGNFAVLEAGRGDDLAKCAEALRAVADLNQFGSDESADDAAEVVRALGYTRVNVIGVSYGTRLASRFASRHPDMVRTVVLRAMATPGFNILRDGAANARTALVRLVADCGADMACRTAFPQLEPELADVREQLRRTRNPISLDLLDLTLYALMLQTPTRQMVPWLIHNAAVGNVLPLAVTAKTVEGVYNTVALGAYLSVVCAEDAPLLTAAEKQQLQTGFSAGTHMVLAACERWPVTAAPVTVPVPSAPTLVVSGAIDPAMPPPVVERAIQGTSAKHVVLPGTAHGPSFPGCAVGIVRTFLESEGKGELNTACVQQLTTPAFRIQ